MKHPAVRPAERKEVHYFDHRADEPLMWYQAFFPIATPGRHRWRTGEASPLYLLHPAVPERMARVLPDVRLITILRDPVERAVSQYFTGCRYGWERRSIEEALDPEGHDPAAPGTSVEAFDERRGDARKFSYLARGRYAEQLERWLAVYPVEQLLVVETAALNDGSAVRRALDHIGLSATGSIIIESHNVVQHPSAPVAVRQALSDYYAPHDSALRSLLGHELSWMNSAGTGNASN